MNNSKIEIKISKLVRTLLDRENEIAARRSDIVTKLKSLNFVNGKLCEEYQLILKVVGNTDEWEDMLNDLDDEICDVDEAINDLEQEFNEYDDMISDIDYAFDSVVRELENGIVCTKLS